LAGNSQQHASINFNGGCVLLVTWLQLARFNGPYWQLAAARQALRHSNSSCVTCSICLSCCRHLHYRCCCCLFHNHAAIKTSGYCLCA
jgi:hypothetical protein